MKAYTHDDHQIQRSPNKQIYMLLDVSMYQGYLTIFNDSSSNGAVRYCSTYTNPLSIDLSNSLFSVFISPFLLLKTLT